MRFTQKFHSINSPKTALGFPRTINLIFSEFCSAPLNRQGIQFHSLTDTIDTGTPSGRFFFHVMANLAEMERDLIVERTRAGLEVARQLGRKGGRKPKMTASKIESARKLLVSGMPTREVAQNLGVSVPTLYRWLPASGSARA